MHRWLDDLGYLCVLATVLLVGCFVVLPIIVAAIMSFDARTFVGGFPPPEFSVRWYKNFFGDEYYLSALKTSLVVAVFATLISTAVGVTAAIALDRVTSPARELLSSLFLSPLVVPGVVMGFALLLFFSSMYELNGLVRLVAGHVILTIPYTIRTTLAGLVGIGKNLTEAALSLGANEQQAFWDITFPLARTGIVAGAVFAFAFSMDDVAASVFLTDPSTVTLPVAMISTMRTSYDPTIAAASVLLVVFTLALVLLLDRLVGLDRIVGQGIYRG